MVIYIVDVKTGNKYGAGTDANVHMKIFGEKTESTLLPLKDSLLHSNKFEKNHTDRFCFDLADLGCLESVFICQDHSGIGSAWYLEKIEISDQKANKTYKFIYDNWLNEKFPNVRLTNPDKFSGSHDMKNYKKERIESVQQGLAMSASATAIVATITGMIKSFVDD